MTVIVVYVSWDLNKYIYEQITLNGIIYVFAFSEGNIMFQ